ncbi:MAG: flagellar motor switch protein FliN [Deltaproteobacteria bacterium]|nr:flagellar motor switch protein FliN [Deltaproteobacteria bacterium]
MADENLEETAKAGGEHPAADSGTGESGDDWAAALDDKNGGSTSTAFEELADGKTANYDDSQNLDFLLDIPLKVTAELGKTTMIINNMLQLAQGSVVELDKTAGEPVDIYVNEKLLGKGEVIVVNEKFGIRITEIISQADRIKSIG